MCKTQQCYPLREEREKIFLSRFPRIGSSGGGANQPWAELCNPLWGWPGAEWSGEFSRVSVVAGVVVKAALPAALYDAGAMSGVKLCRAYSAWRFLNLNPERRPGTPVFARLRRGKRFAPGWLVRALALREILPCVFAPRCPCV